MSITVRDTSKWSLELKECIPQHANPQADISEVEQRKQRGQLHHKVEHPGPPRHIRTFRISEAEQSLQLTVHQYSDMAGQ